MGTKNRKLWSAQGTAKKPAIGRSRVWSWPEHHGPQLPVGAPEGRQGAQRNAQAVRSLDGEVAARHPDRVARPDVDRDVEQQPLRVVALREVVLHGDDLQAVAGVLDDVSSRTLYFMGFVDRRSRRRPFGRERWCGEQDGGEHEGGCDERGTHVVTSNPGAASLSIVAEFSCRGWRRRRPARRRTPRRDVRDGREGSRRPGWREVPRPSRNEARGVCAVERGRLLERPGWAESGAAGDGFRATTGRTAPSACPCCRRSAPRERRAGAAW